VKSLLLVLLGIALLALGADLFHMTYHLTKDAALWKVPGVLLKYAVKISMFLVPLGLLIFRKSWMRFAVFLFALSVLHPGQCLAFWSSGCKQAREMMEESGTARDAKENFFGKIKLQPPNGSFPQEMDKITWWGKFKPFEFWQSPKFQASWIDPEGKEVRRQEFKGEHCALAKNTIKGEEQPLGQFKPGVWKVVITCEDYVIDRQEFAVMPTGVPPPVSGETQTQNPETMMIWAKDQV
jgi:hypothetical protein